MCIIYWQPVPCTLILASSSLSWSWNWLVFSSAERFSPFSLPYTGQNGTINGQGQSWWSKFRKKVLNHTRGPLVQLMRSSNITISNITLRDSPFWTLHIYDCKDVTISDTTILAPIVGAPNTDGIDPGHFPILSLSFFLWFWAFLHFC